MEKMLPDLRKALAKHPMAKAQWNDLTPIAHRDFISWIESAKQDATRARRVEVACSKLEAGQRRPCCYAVVPMGLYKELGTNKKAKATWSTLTPDQKRDFNDWINDAKDSEVTKKRIEKSCALLAAGKRNPYYFSVI